jgi:hypothetical protein
MSDGHRERAWPAVTTSKPREMGTRGGWPFAYVRGVKGLATLGEELRGRFWFNHFGRQSLGPFAIAPRGSIGRRGDLFDHLCLTDPDEL